MIQLLSRVVPVALALLVFLPSSSAAIVSRTIVVTYTHVPGTECVDTIKVGTDPLYFNYFTHRARLGSTEVIWKLDHAGRPSPVEDWWIARESSDHSVCEDRVDFVGDEAKCPASNKFLAASNWTYTVGVSSNAGCPAATVDPEIIFHKGKTSPKDIFLIFLLAAALIGGTYFWFRRKPA